MIRQFLMLVLGLTLCLSICLSSASGQIIVGSGFDQSIQSRTPGALGGGNTNFNLTGRRIRVGHWNNGGNGPGSNIAGVFVFRLPDLGTVENPFLTATFDFVFDGTDPSAAPTYNVDLYGLGRRSLGPVNVVFDYFVGPAGPGANAVLLENNILTPESTGGVFSPNVVNYLNSQYAGGDGAEQFVFFRFSPDFNPNTNIPVARDGYLIFSANNTGEFEGLQPLIDFTTIPLNDVLLGDANQDGAVNFSDISSFIALLSSGDSLPEADIDGNGQVNFLDISPFIGILSGS